MKIDPQEYFTFENFDKSVSKRSLILDDIVEKVIYRIGVR